MKVDRITKNNCLGCKSLHENDLFVFCNATKVLNLSYLRWKLLVSILFWLWITFWIKFKQTIARIFFFKNATTFVTAWKVSVFRVFLVLIFLHSYWMRTRITPNTDTFYAECSCLKTDPVCIIFLFFRSVLMGVLVLAVFVGYINNNDRYKDYSMAWAFYYFLIGWLFTLSKFCAALTDRHGPYDA